MSGPMRWLAALLLLGACEAGAGDGVSDGAPQGSGAVDSTSDGAPQGSDASDGAVSGGVDAPDTDAGSVAPDATGDTDAAGSVADVATPLDDASQGSDAQPHDVAADSAQPHDVAADSAQPPADVPADSAGVEDTDEPPPAPAYQTITPAELAALLEAEDIALVNVHIPYAGTIPGTDAHVPYTDTAGLVKALDADKGKKAVLYCLTGPMSFKAVNDLVDLGFWNVYDLKGGMNAWKAAGYEIVTDP